MKVSLQDHIGYKMCAVIEGVICSHATTNISYPKRKGAIIKDSRGIYLSMSKKFVLDYYSGLAEQEALLTLQFDEKSILTGDPKVLDGEIKVSRCKILDIEYMELDE